MTEKYINLIKKSKKRKRQSRIVIKNGIEYIITLTTDKKPKFKKPKFINQKKWIIKDVLLHKVIIRDKSEIAEIIDANEKEQASYDKAFLMSVDQLYMLLLSQKQFNALARFIEKRSIPLGEPISFIRKGRGFHTRIVFDKAPLKELKLTNGKRKSNKKN